MVFRPAVFDRYVLALSVARICQALSNCSKDPAPGFRRPAAEDPITGIASCCALAVSGNVVAPPNAVDDCRYFSRLPYRITWIEYSLAAQAEKHAELLQSMGIPSDYAPDMLAQMGLLAHQPADARA